MFGKGDIIVCNFRQKSMDKFRILNEMHNPITGVLNASVVRLLPKIHPSSLLKEQLNFALLSFHIRDPYPTAVTRLQLFESCGLLRKKDL